MAILGTKAASCSPDLSSVEYSVSDVVHDGSATWLVSSWLLFSYRCLSDIHIVIKWDQTLTHSFIYAEISLKSSSLVVVSYQGGEWHQKHIHVFLQDASTRQMN